MKTKMLGKKLYKALLAYKKGTGAAYLEVTFDSVGVMYIKSTSTVMGPPQATLSNPRHPLSKSPRVR